MLYNKIKMNEVCFRGNNRTNRPFIIYFTLES
jgi:hypothetical protein